MAILGKKTADLKPFSFANEVRTKHIVTKYTLVKERLLDVGIVRTEREMLNKKNNGHVLCQAGFGHSH